MDQANTLAKENRKINRLKKRVIYDERLYSNCKGGAYILTLCISRIIDN